MISETCIIPPKIIVVFHFEERLFELIQPLGKEGDSAEKKCNCFAKVDHHSAAAVHGELSSRLLASLQR